MSVRLSSLMKDYPCEIRGGNDPVLTGLEYDSRKKVEDTLFFCMPGANIDGHAFASIAYSAGCRAFVVEHEVELPEDAAQVIVKSSRAALAALSAKFYGEPAKKLTLIGITGTKGKTTTAILIKEILCACGIKCGYIGTNGVSYLERYAETVNSTPESRELHRYFRDMSDSGVTHVVMEVSSQALLPHTHRVDGLKFDTVIFTNLGRDHIGPAEHSSFEDYRDAKRRLFTDFGAKNIVWNSDDEYGEYMISGADGRKISYAINNDADFRGSDLTPYRDETSLGIDFDVSNAGVKTGVRLRTPGAFSIYNGMAAIASCTCCGVGVRACADALRKISVNGRFEVVDAIPNITFLIDYAHNGFSLSAALRELRKYEPKRLICIFGTVGGRTKERRLELATAASAYADYSVITSDNPNFEDPDSIIKEVVSHMSGGAVYTAITDREEAVRFAVRIAKEGDILFFAGKGHEKYQLINGEKVPFSERAIILDEAAKIRKPTFAI